MFPLKLHDVVSYALYGTPEALAHATGIIEYPPAELLANNAKHPQKIQTKESIGKS
jgi:hypothetical protein